MRGTRTEDVAHTSCTASCAAPSATDPPVPVPVTARMLNVTGTPSGNVSGRAVNPPMSASNVAENTFSLGTPVGFGVPLKFPVMGPAGTPLTPNANPRPVSDPGMNVPVAMSRNLPVAPGVTVTETMVTKDEAVNGTEAALVAHPRAYGVDPAYKAAAAFVWVPVGSAPG